MDDFFMEKTPFLFHGFSRCCVSPVCFDGFIIRKTLREINGFGALGEEVLQLVRCHRQRDILQAILLLSIVAFGQEMRVTDEPDLSEQEEGQHGLIRNWQRDGQRLRRHIEVFGAETRKRGALELRQRDERKPLEA